MESIVKPAFREDDAELLTSIATDKIIFAQGQPELISQLNQNSVTAKMTIGVIDLFKKVNINHGKGERNVCIILQVK